MISRERCCREGVKEREKKIEIEREREILRNLDWCHVTLGDLKVRVGGEGGRW